MNIGLVLLPMWDPTHPALGVNYIAEALRCNGDYVKLFDYNMLIAKRYNQKKIWDLKKKPALWLGGNSQEWEFHSSFKNRILPYVGKYLDSALNDLVSQIKKNDITVVGFSVFSTNYLTTRYFIEKLRHKFTKDKLKIFVGGVDLHNKQWSDFINDEHIDAAVVGEGEVAVSSLLRAWEKNEIIYNIPGVVSKVSSEEICFTKPEIIADLSELPILNFSDYGLKNYSSAFIPIQMTRGCYARCTFCDEVVFGAKYRSRPAEHIFFEMNKISLRHKNNNFFITDSAINPHQIEVEKLMDLMIESKSVFRLSGNCRISSQLDFDMLKKMYDAGFRHLSFGLESASPRILKLMNKGIAPEWASKNIADCKKIGILVSVNLIIGFPGETEEDFQMTLDFLKNNQTNIETVNTGMGMAITFNSTVWNNPQKFNIKTNADGSVYFGPLGWETLDGLNNSQVREERLKRVRKMLKELAVSYTPCAD